MPANEREPSEMMRETDSYWAELIATDGALDAVTLVRERLTASIADLKAGRDENGLYLECTRDLVAELERAMSDWLASRVDDESCACMGGTADCKPPFGMSGGCALSDDDPTEIERRHSRGGA